MSTGGLFLESISQDEREKARLTNGSMALRVKHVGQFGAHAAAKNAGFQKDDIIVSFDGHTDLQTDSDVLRYGVTEKRPGDFVAVEIMRDGQRKTLKLPIQK
jgi:S1-C subfamily serine protease